MEHIYLYLAFYFIYFSCISLKSQVLSSEISLVIKGTGIQTILNETFYLDPIDVYVNIFHQPSCKKTCEMTVDRNNIILVFEDGINSTENMFYNLNNLIEVDLSRFDASKVTNMNSMFRNCTKLEKITLGEINTSAVVDMSYLFNHCPKLTSIDLSHFDTSSVIKMNYIFSECDSLTSMDLSHFNTSKLEEMHDILSMCNSLLYVNLSGFDTSKVRVMQGLFYLSDHIKYIDLGNFDGTKVANFRYVFGYVKVASYINLRKFKLLEANNVDLHGTFETSSITAKYCIEDSYTKNYLIPDKESYCSDICFQKNIKVNLIPSGSDYDVTCKCNENFKYEFLVKCYDECPGNNETEKDGKLICEGPVGENYYLDSEDEMYRKCYYLCKNCNQAGNETNNNCNSCIENYKFLDDPSATQNNCYQLCDYYYYFDETNQYICTPTESCPTNYNKLIIQKCKCIDDCKNDNEYKYEYENNCLIQCPENTKIYETQKLCLDECYQELFEYGVNCYDDCPTGTYRLFQNRKICVDTLPENYYLDDVDNIYKECNSTGKKCSQPGNETNQDFQTLTPKFLVDQTSLMDVKDYDNIHLIITKKEIYLGIDPQKIGEFTSELPQSASFATYNSQYILAACTNNAFFSYIDISTNTNILNEISILSYSDLGLDLTDYTCSISYINPYAYLVHVSNGDADKIIFNVIRITMDFEDMEGTKNSKTSFTHEYSLVTPDGLFQASCEAIQANNNLDYSAIACVFIEISNNKYSYFLMPSNFYTEDFDMATPYIAESDNFLYSKLQRINSTFIRFLIGNNSFEYKLAVSNFNNQKIYGLIEAGTKRNAFLYSFNSYKDLFYYNNKYIFQADKADETNLNFNLYISNSVSNNNLISIAVNKPLEKVMGYFDEVTDKFIYIYQYSNTIEYFILQYKCFFNAWHIDSDNSIVCYDDKNYCNSNQFFYHNDTRECYSICRDNYFQFNFECFKCNCPENTELISSEDNKCVSTLDYCYIDETTFKTQCNNAPYTDYSMKYENTKIYFKNCDYSLHFFNIKTYSFQNACYKECPDLTTLNSENEECECTYYKYYLNSTKTEFKCLNQNEQCKDYNQFSIISKKECASKSECINQNYKVFNFFCYDSCPENTNDDDNDNVCYCSSYFYKNLETNLYVCLNQNEECSSKGYNYKMDEIKQCFDSLEDCRNMGYKTFNGQCYEECPNNSIDVNNDGNCVCSYFYFKDINNDLYNCLAEGETCESEGYNKKIDNIKQCFTSMDDCKTKGFKTFNGDCVEFCPDNSDDIDNDGICLCSFFYFNDYDTNTFFCLGENELCSSKGYSYKNNDEKQCFISSDDCINKGYKIFNNECLNSCPTNTYLNNDDGICYCSHFFYKNFETGFYYCLSEDELCESKNYDYKIDDIRQCFISLDDCIRKGYRIFNNMCYISCPENTFEKDNDGICYCSNYYFHNLGDNLYDCFEENETCESKNYLYKIDDIKQCFNSLDDCKEKGFKIINNQCYSLCPENTIIKDNDIALCVCENYFFYNDVLNIYDCFDSDKICITANEEYTYTNIETKECFKTRIDCEIKSERVKCKYYENCEPGIDYIFNNICYKNCPQGTKPDLNNPNSKNCSCIGDSKINNATGIIECINNNADVIKENICPENTCFDMYSNELNKCINIIGDMKVYNGICVFSNGQIIYEIGNNISENIFHNKSKTVEIIINNLLNEKNILNVINYKDLEILIENNSIKITLTTSKNQKNNENINKTSINFGECESKLKNEYNISLNSSLYITMIEINEEGMQIPKVEYEIYYPLYNEELIKLNLSICENEKIDILIPIKITDNIDKYNPASRYYNNICYKSTSNYGTDINLNDRKEEYVENNLTLCEENCKFISYNSITQKVKCSCEIKINLPLIDEIKFDKKKLYDNFVDIDNIMNIKVIKCYKEAFHKSAIKNNIGFFIFLFIIILFFITMIIFYNTYHNIYNKIINDIINAKLELEKPKTNPEKINKTEENQNENKSKIDLDNKTDLRIICHKNGQLNLEDNSENILNINFRNTEYITKKKKKTKLGIKQKIIQVSRPSPESMLQLKLIDEELNDLSYEEALKEDKRTYIMYYISLLRIGHLVIFSFFPNKDYNSRIIKMFLFFLNFSITFTINALFFTDGTFHEIYTDKGSFDFIYQVPQIIYSSLISIILNAIMKYLSLSQKNILDLKHEKNMNILKSKGGETFKK